MKVMVCEPTSKEMDINFSLISITEKSDFGISPAVILFMQFNERTYNAICSLVSFKDKESAWATLEPMIKTLLDKCYSNQP